LKKENGENKNYVLDSSAFLSEDVLHSSFMGQAITLKVWRTINDFPIELLNKRRWIGTVDIDELKEGL